MITKMLNEYNEYLNTTDEFQRYILESSVKSSRPELMVSALTDYTNRIPTDAERFLVQPIINRIMEKVIDRLEDYSDTIKLIEKILYNEEFRETLLKQVEDMEGTHNKG